MSLHILGSLCESLFYLNIGRSDLDCYVNACCIILKTHTHKMLRPTVYTYTANSAIVSLYLSLCLMEDRWVVG